MENLSSEQLTELYYNNDKKAKELTAENNNIEMELKFRSQVNYESSESINQEVLSSFFRYQGKESYFLHVKELNWFVQNKKNDKKCSPYFKELNMI